jgi:eukaryotic-like serine/threonine-protein kinase
MGEVYKARDTRLDRTVAIKILPEALAADSHFRERFDREARAISQLDHPHICALHDVGEHGGTSYLVLQYLEGETLEARLKRGALPLLEALQYASQIADALDRAHRAGIVHRDLKPGNIMLTTGGTKLLDFGLAKTIGPAGGEGTSIVTRLNPTAHGVVLGTFQYMAPEQLDGRTCDARADIFAMGLIIYEMATGKRLIRGQAVTGGGLPDRVAHVIDRCLASEPDDRWQSARDLKAEIEYAAKPPPNAPVAGVRRSHVVLAGISLVLAVAVALAWSSRRMARTSESRMIQVEMAPPMGSEFQPDRGVALSPDGHLVAFVAGGTGADTLWVRALDASAAQQLAGTNGATFPFWSPDSRSVAFFRAGKLWKVEIAGGSPTPICDVPVGRGGTWNAEGTILFNAVNDGPLLRVSATGGTPVPVTTVDTANNENSHRWPFFLPDGRRFLYLARGSAGADVIYEGSLDRPADKTRIRLAANNAVFAPGEQGEGGRLLWVNGQGSLMSQDFDARTGTLSADPSVVAEGVAFGNASKLGAVSVSGDGTLIYAAALQDLKQLTWVGRDGQPQGTVGQPDAYTTLRISPDGTRVAVARSQEISEIEFSGGIPVRVGTGSFNPVWSPDGRQLAYARGAPVNMVLQTLSGADHDVALHDTHDSEMPLDWSPDGRFLLFRVTPNDPSSKTQLDLYLLSMTGDRKVAPLMASSFREWWGRFSPDGKWIAYVSDESGTDEVYVQPFPAGGTRWRLSTKGGTAMVWRRDAKELLYISPDRKMMSVAIDGASGSLKFDPPRPLFSIPLVADQGTSIYTYDIAPDGQRFLVISPTRETRGLPLNIRLHWQRRLETQYRATH